VLRQQGYGRDSVVPAGARVLVQRNGNLSVDVTEQIHPANAALIVLAARTIGLDVAGVDLVVEDISRPMREQGGAVLEVNAMPGMMMHLRPGAGQARAVNEIIMAAVFPNGQDGRIPVVAVNGNGACEVAREVGRLLMDKGLTVGLACSEGTFVNGELTRPGNWATSRGAADLLMHPLLEVAVVETPDTAIDEEGLGFDRCDVAVFTGGVSAAAGVLASCARPGGAITGLPRERLAAEAVGRLAL
jgi:cyanophycin synthetase